MGGAADWLKTEGVNIVDWNVNGDHNLRLRINYDQKELMMNKEDKNLLFKGM
ncbi:hypothetical protein RirG_124030 [Rhizophagus irregularis DAOM 197198w]|uniref:Uncharacterized protein n=1 Tax=Rhizophagus irregularis (strain DAOM 197198w) TaxID=1432141 RepID=A0A015JH20_RHIIW|nr:hypothetical protein RirG_124030 [Rhizophagus irregularis DAOM 197198w]